MRRASVLFIILCGLLAGCGRFPDPDATPTKPVQWHGRLEPSFAFESAATDRTHRIRVYLPASYATAPDRRYPVLYMTDAQWAFAFYAETLDWKRKEVILIGVDQVSEFRRWLDFTPLRADAYLQFLTQELVTAIDQKYRTEAKRGFMGVSLGGLLGAIQLSRELPRAPFFQTYLLFDPTLAHYPNSALRAEETRRQSNERLDLTLILTGANPGNGKLVTEFAARYQQRNHQGLVLHHKDYAVPHAGIAAPSFGDFVDVAFPGP